MTSERNLTSRLRILFFNRKFSHLGKTLFPHLLIRTESIREPSIYYAIARHSKPEYPKVPQFFFHFSYARFGILEFPCRGVHPRLDDSRASAS